MKESDKTIIDKWITILTFEREWFNFKDVFQDHSPREKIEVKHFKDYGELINFERNILIQSSIIEPVNHNEIGFYKLTLRAKEIFESGGVDNWLQLEKEKSDYKRNLPRLTQQLQSSTISTNQSIRDLNDKTKEIYCFQKWSTRLTILIIATGVVFSYFQINDEPQIQVLQSDSLSQKIIPQIEGMQYRIDSLQIYVQSLKIALPDSNQKH